MSMTNCPNCGSAKNVNEVVCPFCGDLTDIDLESKAPCIVRFRMGESTFQLNAYVSATHFEIHNDFVCAIRNELGQLVRGIPTQHVKAKIEFVEW